MNFCSAWVEVLNQCKFKNKIKLLTWRRCWWQTHTIFAFCFLLVLLFSFIVGKIWLSISIITNFAKNETLTKLNSAYFEVNELTKVLCVRLKSSGAYITTIPCLHFSASSALLNRIAYIGSAIRPKISKTGPKTSPFSLKNTVSKSNDGMFACALIVTKINALISKISNDKLANKINNAVDCSHWLQNRFVLKWYVLNRRQIIVLGVKSASRFLNARLVIKIQPKNNIKLCFYLPYNQNS